MSSLKEKSLLYNIFCWCGFMFGLHGIIFCILTMIYHNDMIPIEIAYLVYRAACAIGFMAGHIGFNTIRYNTNSKVEWDKSIGKDYVFYQKACFFGILMITNIQNIYFAIWHHDILLTCVDMIGELWLLYSLIYRIFTSNVDLMNNGNWNQEYISAGCPFKS